MAEVSHASVVDEWMGRAFATPGAAEIAPLFGLALRAIWDRAVLPLGEVSLRAITQRVLFGATSRFPVLCALHLSSVPESFDTLTSTEAQADRQRLLAAIRFVLVELLTLIGTLTAEILTVALHDALRAVDVSAEAPAKPIASRRGVSE
jgi:hypothetical protein